jgi:hypothetical protein
MAVYGVFIGGSECVICLLSDGYVGSSGCAWYPVAEIGARPFGKKLKQWGQRAARSDALRGLARASIAAVSMYPGLPNGVRTSLLELSRRLPAGEAPAMVLEAPSTLEEVAKLLAQAARATEEAEAEESL